MQKALSCKAMFQGHHFREARDRELRLNLGCDLHLLRSESRGHDIVNLYLPCGDTMITKQFRFQDLVGNSVENNKDCTRNTF